MIAGRARWACKVVWVAVVSVKSYCCVLLLLGLGLHCVMLVSCTPEIWHYSVQDPCSWISFSPCGLLVSALHCTHISCHGHCRRNQGSTNSASIATCKRSSLFALARNVFAVNVHQRGKKLATAGFLFHIAYLFRWKLCGCAAPFSLFIMMSSTEIVGGFRTLFFFCRKCSILPNLHGKEPLWTPFVVHVQESSYVLGTGTLKFCWVC
jgi:hypothetical protein